MVKMAGKLAMKLAKKVEIKESMIDNMAKAHKLPAAATDLINKAFSDCEGKKKTGELSIAQIGKCIETIEADIKKIVATMTPGQIVEWIAIEAVSQIEIKWNDIKKVLDEFGPEVDVILPILHVVFNHLTHGKDEVSVGAIIKEMEDIFHKKHKKGSKKSSKKHHKK